MKKNEILKDFRIDKLGHSTVFISNKHFQFSFTFADDIVKEEYKGQYKYFGGLQCSYNEGSENYKNIERWLVKIAETVLSL